ncbi:MAG: hypothetical protein JNK23_08100 [Opitutaceae bacterium]|nr:hypothetical protein [Opitutaceae bacterium]
MLIDWPLLAAALALLLTPIGLFHGARTRHRALGSDWSDYWRRTLSHGFHTIDLLRAALGAWYLAAGVGATPQATGLAAHAPLLVQGAVLGLGTVLQTFVCKERHAACAPFAYMAGCALGFLPVETGFFALLLAIVFALGVRAPALFFPALGATTVGVGIVVTGAEINLAGLAAAVVFTAPWLLTLLFPRELTVAHLARRATSERLAAGTERK